MEVGQGPNWGCSAKEKKMKVVNTYTRDPRTYISAEIFLSLNPYMFVVEVLSLYNV
jgi:hypothetical protein